MSLLLRASEQLRPMLRSPVYCLGIDPALRVRVLDELTPGDCGGVTQVQGFHSQSRAFHFQGSSREVKASAGVSERIVHKLRGKREFTVLATLRQEHLNSGVILSIHHSEQREMMMMNPKAEIRPTENVCSRNGNVRI
ncbi:hypothetical protein CRUP_015292 [Coryphaenoides rupestris]|nr:hypothetical protein CRUP_015292 [Coryphaenoides rupestris]